MKYIRRLKKSPQEPARGNSPGPLAAGGGQSAREVSRSPSGQQQSTPQAPEAEPAAPAPKEDATTPRSKASSKKELEKEVQALREENDRLAREKKEVDAQKASEKKASEQQVRNLSREVEELKSQAAQRARDDVSDDSAGGGDFRIPCFEGPTKSAYVPLTPRSGRVAGGGVPRKIFIAACAFMGLETALLVGFACAYFAELRPQDSGSSSDRHDGDLRDVVSQVPALQDDLRESMDQEKYWEHRFTKDATYWEKKIARIKAEANVSDEPYKMITGLVAHQVPELYGKVREKTIWAYWYHPENCKTSKECVLPPVVQLCSETIERNKGSFDFKIVHMDEVDKYVNRMELPMRWDELIPAHQKDSLMNALLARYGGVAMDISTLLLRPLDDYWEEMVMRGATFMGYMYRLNGLPWRHAETTSVWFLMSRREGIFSTAVRNQVIGMGDRRETGAYHHWYLALGDQTLTPLLHMFNYSLPKCTEDRTIVSPPPSPQWDQKASMCPEHEMHWSEEISGTARNDTKVVLRDPRDGPQLPFAFGAGMALWDTSDTRAFLEATVPSSMRDPGAPMQHESCNSPAECWQVFMQRYEAPPVGPGRARVLDFVKLFAHAKELKGMSREEILRHENSFFVHWLRLAGVS